MDGGPGALEKLLGFFPFRGEGMEVVLKYSRKVPKEEVSPEFLAGMLNRMVIGFPRYGALSKNWRPAWKRIGDTYRKFLHTRNREFLFDIANYAMSEFMHPRLEGSHYTPVDQGEGKPAIAYFRDLGKGG